MPPTNDPYCCARHETGGMPHHHFYYTFLGTDSKTGRQIDGAYITTYFGDFNIARETEILAEAHDVPIIKQWLPISCLQYTEYSDLVKRWGHKKAVAKKKHLQIVSIPLPSKDVTNNDVQGEGPNASIE